MKCRKADWFNDNDPEILNLPDAKWQTHDVLLVDPLSELKKARHRVPCSMIHQMQNMWFDHKVDKRKVLAEKHDCEGFCDVVKVCTALPTLPCNDQQVLMVNFSSWTTLPSSNGWQEHFSELLNHPSTVSDESLGNIHKLPTLSHLPIHPCELRC